MVLNFLKNEAFMAVNTVRPKNRSGLPGLARPGLGKFVIPDKFNCLQWIMKN